MSIVDRMQDESQYVTIGINKETTIRDLVLLKKMHKHCKFEYNNVVFDICIED